MDIISLYLLFYGVLALSHILIQMFLAHHERMKQAHPDFVARHASHLPSVSVIVPCYNERPELLNACLNSIKRQNYRGKVDVYVIDDGSKNRRELEPVYEEFMEYTGFYVFFQKGNRGKRMAQKMAFDRSDSEIYVTIDSDTTILPGGVGELVKQFKDPGVGAVTGEVRVKNKGDNFLTRLISYRYWTAFHQERAAQSLFDVLMCCSGPFSAYRKSAVDEVKGKYVSQFFLGKRCTFGDDRHLTNLILERGHIVRFDNKAIAYTNVPDNLKSYLKQQVRWNKSFYREMLWTMRYAHKHHFYLIYDLALQFILPFMLLIALGIVACMVAGSHVEALWAYIGILIAIALLRATYGMIITRDPGFLTFVAYGFMHVFLLIPVRMYALATIGKGGWGTR